MKKKRDIKKPEDIRKIMEAFLDQIKTDPVIGHYFTREVHTNWDTFLPLMCRFWENILFYSGGYFGNPMERHMQIHAIEHLTPEHFKHWLEMLNTTVDLMFEGDKAEMMKERAANIAVVLQAKLTL